MKQDAPGHDPRNLCVLGFTPPAEAPDGKFHKPAVKTGRKDLTAFPVRLLGCHAIV